MTASDDERLLTVWVIYDHPKDYPDGFVLRAQTVERGGKITPGLTAYYAPTANELRKCILTHIHGVNVCLPRFEDDDPCILETWI